MEGLVDEHMRTLLTRHGDFDHCVTEFLRITTQTFPVKVFRKICPEMDHDWKTPSGTPVHLQLLGSDPHAMTDNACLAIELGAPVIDVNFGCPSKCVNDNFGGSILLKDPENLYRVLSAMRRAMPSHIPLTAKMRLGYADKSLAIENAQAIEAAGASEVCVHARTKVEGYKPPAHWQWIKQIKDKVKISVVANGEIWNVSNFVECQQQSDCNSIMLGRGAVTNPILAHQIRQHLASQPMQMNDWQHRLQDLLWMLDATLAAGNLRYAPDRIKQWLAYLKKQYLPAQAFFEKIRTLKQPLQIRDMIIAELAMNQR